MRWAIVPSPRPTRAGPRSTELEADRSTELTISRQLLEADRSTELTISRQLLEAVHLGQLLNANASTYTGAMRRRGGIHQPDGWAREVWEPGAPSCRPGSRDIP